MTLPSTVVVAMARDPRGSTTQYRMRVDDSFLRATVGRFTDTHDVGWVAIRLWRGLAEPFDPWTIDHAAREYFALTGETRGRAPLTWSTTTREPLATPLSSDEIVEQFGPLIDWLLALDGLGLFAGEYTTDWQEYAVPDAPLDVLLGPRENPRRGRMKRR